MQPLQRVALLRFLDLVAVAVDGVVVVARVRKVTLDVELDDARPASHRRELHRGRSRLVRGAHVGAVDGRAGHGVAAGAQGEALDGHLARERDGDGVLVVLDEEDDGEFVDGGEVHRLVHFALAGGAVAEEAGDHRVLAAHLHAERPADGVGDVRADDVGVVDELQLGGGPVLGELARAGERFAVPREEAAQRLLRREAESCRYCKIAVVGEAEEVRRVLAERPDSGELRALVALAGCDDGRLPLPVHRPHALVQRANEEHGGVDVQQVFRRQRICRSIGEAGLQFRICHRKPIIPHRRCCATRWARRFRGNRRRAAASSVSRWSTPARRDRVRPSGNGGT